MRVAEPQQPRISLIVPAFNEEHYLGRLLDSVDVARSCYRRGPDAVEVVVADDGSTDATSEIATVRGCRVVRLEARKIAAARNAGAASARGLVFAFVDADTRIHPDTFNAIDDLIASPKVAAGTTGVTPERWSLGIAVTFAILVPWVWLLRMDTGVVFCRADDFRAVGGYDERRSFGEDVQLLVDLRRLGRQRGRRLARAGSVKAVSSTRKFDRHGEWHYFRLIRHLLLPMIRQPELRDELVETYWYGDR